MSFSEYCESVSKSLDISYRPKYAYKLCDLRPFYGVIHKDLLKKYTFWGFGDIDLIYGNLKKWLTDDVLAKYDVISSHVSRISGHFSLFRCNSKYTSLCFKIDNWKEQVCADHNIGLDENAFTMLVIPHKTRLISAIYWRIYQYFSKDFSRFKRFFGKYCWYSRDKYFREMLTTFIPEPGVVFRYDLETLRFLNGKGKSTYVPKNFQMPYLHFLFFKKTPFYETERYWKPGYFQIPQDFDFSSGGIVEISTEFMRIAKS